MVEEREQHLGVGGGVEKTAKEWGGVKKKKKILYDRTCTSGGVNRKREVNLTSGEPKV